LAKTSRQLAFSILLNAEMDRSRYIDDLLSSRFHGHAIPSRDKRWIMELVYGVTRLKLQLDARLQAVFKGRFRKAQYPLKVLLRMGAYQLIHMQTPEHAAVNEMVKLARQVGQSRSANLVNAVLRHIHTYSLEDVIKQSSSDLERLAIETSHPEWLLSKWIQRYDVPSLKALCAHDNSIPRTWIRRNIQHVAISDFEAFLSREGVSFTRSDILDVFYQIESGGSLLTTPEFKDGWFSFQDLAAGLVTSLIDAEQGQTILDACAAPGGKMAYLAEITGDRSPLIACDVSPSRLGKVSQNIQRLKLKGIDVRVKDAAVDQLPLADRILLDVPCSGTGVLNRRPDARWKRQAEDTASLVGIQSRILVNAWQSLNPGGKLIYATCTLEPEENWGVVDSVFDQLTGAVIKPIVEPALKAFIDERGALATLPWKHAMDGMFAVKLSKGL